MGAVVKIIDGKIVIAPNRVHAPGYTILVANVSASTVLPDGWVYVSGEVSEDDFTSPWTQPTGAQDAYSKGDEVLFSGKIYRSVIDSNVWAPDITGWVVQTTDESPAWRQPLGAHDAYSIGSVVSYGGKLWKSLLDANVWAPGVSGWRETFKTIPSGAPQIPAWVQPTGAQDAYQIGNKVTYGGQTWQSTAADNVWAPDVYGWVVI
jgi:hypothetical protein